MPKTNPDVLAAVERALTKNPNLSSTELQQEAAKVDEKVTALTGRQFHARYALPIKRKLGGPRKSPAKKKSARGRKRAQTRTARTSRAQRNQRRTDRNDPVRAALQSQFDERRDELHKALDQAVKRSIEGDSLQRVNRLLGTLDKQIEALQKA